MFLEVEGVYEEEMGPIQDERCFLLYYWFRTKRNEREGREMVLRPGFSLVTGEGSKVV